MALSQDQIAQLTVRLSEEKEKLESVLKAMIEDSPASDTERTNDNADLGTEATESHGLIEHESLARETQILLDRVYAALGRIEDGTYGRTADGEEIPFERLLIEPTATTLVS